MPDVVVIGAGISGAAAAYELARDGLNVLLLDRYAPAAMASGWTLAGVRQSGRIPTGRVVLAAGVFGNELLNPLGLAVPLEMPMVTVVRSAPGKVVLEQVIGVANADCAGRQETDGYASAAAWCPGTAGWRTAQRRPCGRLARCAGWNAAAEPASLHG